MDIQRLGVLLRNVQPIQRRRKTSLRSVSSYADIYLFFTKTIQHIDLYLICWFYLA